MSEQRFIHRRTFTSPDFNSLSPAARLLFLGMIATADDYGRGRGDALSLKMAVFPGDPFAPEQVRAWADEVARRGMARFYGVNGCLFYDLPNWPKYQHPKYKAASQVPPFHEDARSRPDPGPDPGQTRPGSGPEVRSGLDWSGEERTPPVTPPKGGPRPAPVTPKVEPRKPTPNECPDCRTILDDFNLESGRQFTGAGRALKFIHARHQEHGPARCVEVARAKIREAMGDPETRKWANPETVFRPGNFERALYADAAPAGIDPLDEPVVWPDEEEASDGNA